MTIDTHLSRRPVAVSSMSSLDSAASANDATRKMGPDPTADSEGESLHATNNNIVSSSTLNSIAPSPPHSFETAPPHVSSAGPSGMLLSAPVSIMPSVSSAAKPAGGPVQAASNNTVAEFLFQLTKMLTDDNREVIEWANGQINVHDPYKLASDVLHKYFRHSKFASFQRQLNYFGFRKLAGKGKMAPCSYVNEAATNDLRSLLLIKRKSSATPSKDKTPQKRERGGSGSSSGANSATAPVNPVLAGILQRNSGPSLAKRPKTASALAPPVTNAKLAVGKGIKHQLNGFLKNPASAAANPTSGNSPQALAQAAVGKGVRHGLSMPSGQQSTAGSATAALASSQLTFLDPPQLGLPDLQQSLSELTNNYKNSLQSAAKSEPAAAAPHEGTTEETNDGINELDSSSFNMYSFLSRDSSLVDLAMLIPNEESVEPTPVEEMRGTIMSFVDFPQQDQETSHNSDKSD